MTQNWQPEPEPLELGETGIKVGVNPDPEPPQDMILKVEFKCSDGSIYFKEFVIPRNTYAQRMELSAKRSDGKELGPIIVTNFHFHPDSRQLHSLCRRVIDPEELPYEPTEIEGPSNGIDTVEL